MAVAGVPTELGTEKISKLLRQYAVPAIIAMTASFCGGKKKSSCGKGRRIIPDNIILCTGERKYLPLISARHTGMEKEQRPGK